MSITTSSDIDTTPKANVYPGGIEPHEGFAKHDDGEQLPDDPEALKATVAKLTIKAAYAKLIPMRERAEALRAEGTKTANTHYRILYPKIRALEHHIHTVQQGLPVLPRPDADEQARTKHTTKMRPLQLENRALELEAALLENKLPTFPKVRDVVDKLALSPIERLLSEEVIQKLIGRYTNLRRHLVVEYIRSQDLLDPDGRLDALKLEMADCKDLDRIRELRVEIAETTASQGSANRRATDAARGILLGLKKPVDDELIGITFAAEYLLEQYRDEAITAETQWLASYGLPHSPTQVSQRYQAALDKFVTRRNALMAPKQPFTSTSLAGISESQVERWFGIKLD